MRMFIGEGKAPQARSGSALCAMRALPLATAAVFRNWRLVVIPGISIMQEPRKYYESKRLSSPTLMRRGSGSRLGCLVTVRRRSV
jgi:hypothetical protein